MPFYEFGCVRIFRPSHETEAVIRKQAAAHIRSRFPPGEYRGSTAANAVVQHHFKFYEAMLCPLIPKLTSSDAMQFLLFQYDEASRILHGSGILDLAERELWTQIEGDFKRAIKHLVELLCISGSESRLTTGSEEVQFTLECALVCAESMVHLAHESDVLHGVFPNDCVVRVVDSGPITLEIKTEGSHDGYDRRFSDRVIRDRQSRDRFVGFPQFDNHTAEHQRYLDDAFTNSFEMSYGEFVESLRVVIDNCKPSLHPRAFPILFVHRGRVIEELARSGRPRAAIKTALDGFSTSASKLTTERREVWKPKQDSRAYRRGFFVFQHETGEHLAFSRAMARENLIQLVNWVCYRRLPREWKTPLTQKAVEAVSRASGTWFEGVVCQNLDRLAICGGPRHRTIRRGESQLRIPDSVGEIDFLGYHCEHGLLVLVESKMVMTGLEGSYWRDDLDEFVRRPGSYADRFRRKLAWVSENRRAIGVALGLDAVAGVGAAMLTLYPCIAREFIPDFPCVSVTEFMLDYERKARWPYPLV